MSVFIPIPKKANAKECSNYCTTALISHTSKVMLKILQARLQQYLNCELPDVQAGFIKSRGTRDQIANIRWIIKKAREFQKNIYFCFIEYAKANRKPKKAGVAILISDKIDLKIKITRDKQHPTPVLLPGKSHGWRSLVGCSPWSR